MSLLHRAWPDLLHGCMLVLALRGSHCRRDLHCRCSSLGRRRRLHALL
jgi:hypothetical protein